MQPQLQAIVDEFHSAQTRLCDLYKAVPEESWPKRPGPSRWSVAECVAHLNLTSTAYLPLLRAGIANGRKVGRGDAGHHSQRYRRDLVGWFFWRVSGPPVRVRGKTTAPFVPTSTGAPSDLIAEFDRLQQEQVACVREANGLPLDRITITSPFFSWIHYNLFACLSILPRHQHRHLWQAEQAWQELQQRLADPS